MRTTSRILFVVSLGLAVSACSRGAKEGEGTPPTPAPKDTQSARATPPPAATAAAPAAPASVASPDAAFKASNAKGSLSAPEGCFTNIGEHLNVMVGRNAKKPCDVDGEDDFVLSFEMNTKGTKTLKALPKPGEVFEDRVYVEPSGAASGTYVQAKIEVLRQEKPYVVVRLTPKAGLPDGVRSFGGVVKVKMQPENEVFLLPHSWVNEKAKADELVITDIHKPNAGIESCGSGDVVVVLPARSGEAAWKLAADKELGEARRGPNKAGEEFRWDGLKSEPGRWQASFTSGSDKVKVDIRIEPRMACD